MADPPDDTEVDEELPPSGAGAGTGPEVPPTGPFPGGALLPVVASAAD